MPCQATVTDVWTILIEVLHHHVPPNFVLTGQTPLEEIPIPVVVWQVYVYREISLALRQRGCCFQTLLPQTLYADAPILAALLKRIVEDLGACPTALARDIPPTPSIRARRRSS